MSENTPKIELIRHRLAADDRIPHPAEIAVLVKAGTATLRGTVGSFHQRHAAVEVTRAVRWIRDVEDELVVDLRDHWQDYELRGAALQALIASDGVPDDRVNATVSDGWLTLKGEVKRQDVSNDAFAAVSAVGGLGGITNQITVITAGLGG